MSKILWKSLLVSPAVLGAALVASAGAIAAESAPATSQVSELAAVESLQSVEAVASQSAAPEAPVAEAAPSFAEPTTLAQAADAGSLSQINTYSMEGRAADAGQVTSVSQLSDVQPTDWAFQALQSLVERYGCIAGYPDGTYRGNRAMTRYEFAAGLNACLDRVNELIAAGTADLATREDLATLQRLQEEFAAELATLRGRVDSLEARTAELEANQFSTTTKLNGEAIFALTDSFGDNDDNEIVFGNRVRLALESSFTGRDKLVTRLAAGNLSPLPVALGTPESTQTFNLSDSDNDIVLDWLSYTFPFGNSRVYVAATGGIHSNYAPTLNPYFEDYDGGNGALSTFASESPIYRIGGGAGAAVSFGFSPLESILGPSTITLGYLAGGLTTSDPASPAEKNGLFNGDYAALAQANFNVSDRFGLGLTYVHGYHTSGSAIFDLGSGNGVVGSTLANFPSLGTSPTVTNSYGVEAAFRLSDRVSVSGYGAYTDAKLVEAGDAEIWTYGLGVAFPDLGKEGNLLGIFAGAQPYAGLIEVPGSDYRNQEVPFHVEAFYKYQLNDNISITPGVIWLTSPNEDIFGSDSDAVIGTLRTTFKF